MVTLVEVFFIPLEINANDQVTVSGRNRRRPSVFFRGTVGYEENVFALPNRAPVNLIEGFALNASITNDL